MFLIVLGGIFWGLSISKDVNEAGVEGSSIYFKTPGFIIPIINGKPDKIIKHDVSGATEYVYYDQKIFQHDSTIYYNCLMGLNRIYVEIPIDDQDGMETFYYISDYMCDIYSHKDGFYNEGIIENTEDETISQQFGADFKATGISVKIELESGWISISATYQY